MILVLNAGSSSLRWALFDTHFLHEISTKPLESGIEKGVIATHAGGQLKAHLHQVYLQVEPYLPAIEAVCYRIVHGGGKFVSPVEITKSVQSRLQHLRSLAPLHMPRALTLIEAGRTRFKEQQHIGVFDTAFFNNLPVASQTLPIPWEWTRKYHIRRYGFHGFSHKGAAKSALEFFRKRHRRSTKPARIITAHVGQGISVAALNNLDPIDTTMGFTPNDGLPMPTRSGSLDAGLMFFLYKQFGVDVFRALNERAGLAAIAGTSADFREMFWAAGYPVTGKDEWRPPEREATPVERERARLAIEVLTNALIKTIGGYISLLGGADVICFTGGLGAQSQWFRESITNELKKVTPFYIHSVDSQEEREMALEAYQFLRHGIIGRDSQ